jgi:hypothetical protein
MERVDLQLRLMEVKAHIALAEGRVLRQQGIARKLDQEGDDGAKARAALRVLEGELSALLGEYFEITRKMAEVAEHPARWHD